MLSMPAKDVMLSKRHHLLHQKKKKKFFEKALFCTLCIKEAQDRSELEKERMGSVA